MSRLVRARLALVVSVATACAGVALVCIPAALIVAGAAGAAYALFMVDTEDGKR